MIIAFKYTIVCENLEVAQRACLARYRQEISPLATEDIFEDVMVYIDSSNDSPFSSYTFAFDWVEDR